jgi:hypothetical protein
MEYDSFRARCWPLNRCIGGSCRRDHRLLRAIEIRRRRVLCVCAGSLLELTDAREQALDELIALFELVFQPLDAFVIRLGAHADGHSPDDAE